MESLSLPSNRVPPRLGSLDSGRECDAWIHLVLRTLWRQMKRSFSVEVESVAHSKLPSGREASGVVVRTGLSAEDKAGLPPRSSKPVVCQPTFL